ncbi:MAG: ATP-binding cassette domain-containing protein, partial [Actinomycetota bacterium]|nr:ATP-binding cassette domain-containing protein [Actinomycetota bacterium]
MFDGETAVVLLVRDRSRPPPTAAQAERPGDGDVASVKDLEVSFPRPGGTVRALRGVTLDIASREVVAVVGESGSGKSVLSLALLGLLGREAHVVGGARVCGVDMVSADAETRRLVRRDHLGAVFQDPMTSLNPTMRVGRQLVEATGSVEEAVRLLDLTGVPDPRSRLRTYPHELSGGLRQRVMVAMAVAGRPSLVVADEPTTALDVTVQAQILELLGNLRSELGTSVLFVTHDLGVAASLADRVLVFYGGRLVESGPTAAVVERPSHHYTAGLLGARLDLMPGSSSLHRQEPLTGSPIDPRSEADGCLFAPRCPAASETCSNDVPALRDRAGSGQLSACHHPVEIKAGGAVASDPTPPLAASNAPRLDRIGTAVRLDQVRCDFKVKGGTLAALRGVDLQVGLGESVAIVGESGCGKSTLLRVIAGLRSPTGGSVEVGGGATPQMVFQDAGASLTPWLSVGEILEDRLRSEGMARGVRQRVVGEALRRVGLSEDIASARARHLSGGQRQRVALARATIV